MAQISRVQCLVKQNLIFLNLILILLIFLFFSINKINYTNNKSVGRFWFNIGLEQLSGLLPTVWVSSRRMIRRHAIAILICHGGNSPPLWYLQRYNFLNGNLEANAPKMDFTCTRCRQRTWWCFARQTWNQSPLVRR